MICLRCRNLYCGSNLSSSSEIALESNEDGIWIVGMVLYRTDFIWLAFLSSHEIKHCRLDEQMEFWRLMAQSARSDGRRENTHWWGGVIRKPPCTTCSNLASPITYQCNGTGLSFSDYGFESFLFVMSRPDLILIRFDMYAISDALMLCDTARWMLRYISTPRLHRRGDTKLVFDKPFILTTRPEKNVLFFY